MLLETYKCMKLFWCLIFSGTCAFLIISTKNCRNSLVLLPVGSTYPFCCVSRIMLNCRWDWRCFHICDTCFVSVVNNFFHPQSATDYGYYVFGEVAHFVYCLLQKLKKSSVLPLVEQLEEYMAPNPSRFTAIDEEHFLVGTQVLVALEEAWSFNSKKYIRPDFMKFLEDFLNCVMLIIAARSAIGQGLSSFCPPLLIRGDDRAPMQLFNMLLDGLLEKGWVGGAEMEAYRSQIRLPVICARAEAAGADFN